MQSTKEIKLQIREFFAGRWGQAFFITLVLTFFRLAASMLVSPFLGGSTTGLYYALAILFVLSILYTILRAGYLYYFLQLLRGNAVRSTDLYHPLKAKPDRFLVVGAIEVLLGCAFLVPAVLMLTEIRESVASLVLFVIWLFLGGALFVFLMLSFFAALPLLLDDENLGPIDAMKKSARLLQGKRGQFLRLVLSFSGWLVPMLLTGGLAQYLIRPYLAATMAQYYRLLQGEGSLSSSSEDRPASEETFPRT